MENAAEVDQDVQLQRQSADLLDDFQQSLKPFLWKTLKSGRTKIRSQVRTRDTQRLVNLLEPFQELPQLLDPHLDNFVTLLAAAFLAFLQAPPTKHPAENTQLLIPLSKATCKLLYTFCKIRGDKVIVRFWSTETRYLELLLTAIESNKAVENSLERSDALAWDWEERYITLLWLSQLLLAPFDLATISSTDMEDIPQPNIPGLVWPSNTPTITLRAVSLGIQYLSSSGKERDAAKVLLVRIAMRRDMQALGIQEALMKWALSRLQSSKEIEGSTYHYIGVLSFLAAILVSSVGTTSMDPFVERIARVVQNLITERSAEFGISQGSAVARKAIIKILRTIVVILLQNPDSTSEMIEFTIGHMLESLADSATPVRLAASKALSIITLKLPSDMASEVVGEVLASLKKDLLWTQKGSTKIRNLSRVDPLEWHGLTLTLSHLVYRQSVPASSLAPVLDALRLALSFNQRSISGSHIGMNVRDAACFGIWAVARRYKTTDLESIRLSPDVNIDSQVEASVSALQTLANDLVVSACVDPAGNIRRGSSAALQELIGRHPNTILEGIQVVQVVDYHAVALRTRAIREVAVSAARLSEEYRTAILQALLGWRGVRDANPLTRRVAASTVEALVWQRHLVESPSFQYVQRAIDDIARHIKELELREMNERHGLILAFAGVTIRVTHVSKRENLHTEFHRMQKHGPSLKEESGLFTTLTNIHGYVVNFLKQFESHVQNSRQLQLDLLAHAFSELTIASNPILRRLTLFSGFGALRTRDTKDVSLCDAQCWIRRLIANPLDLRPNPHKGTLASEYSLFATFMKSATIDNFGILSVAAERFAVMESGLTAETPMTSLMVGQWILDVISSRGKKDLVYIYALVQIYPLLKSKLRDDSQLDTVWASLFESKPTPFKDSPAENWQYLVLHAVMSRWENDADVGARQAILQCLARYRTTAKYATMLQTHASSFMKIIQEGLQDFTTNERGDIGSDVRMCAARAASAMLSLPLSAFDRGKLEERLVGGILRIAAGKLDKVRIEGQKALAKLFDHTSDIATLNPSSKEYFSRLLRLQTEDWWMASPHKDTWSLDLLEGCITSADTGSEDLVRASRAALVDYCNDGHYEAVCGQLFSLLRLSPDRIVVPTLEIISFLFDMQIMQKSSLNWTSCHKQISGAHFKSSNVRKLQACIKIYGGMIEVYPEAVTKLSSMLIHGYPSVRNAAADELWVVKGVCKGVDWARAKKGDMIRVREEMGQNEKTQDA